MHSRLSRSSSSGRSTDRFGAGNEIASITDAVTIVNRFGFRMQLGDLDNHKDADLAVNGATVWTNDGSGSFTKEKAYNAYVAFVFALVNGDLFLDLPSDIACRANERSSGMSILAVKGFFPAVSRVVSVAAGDVEGDGDPDPILAAMGLMQIGGYENTDSELPVELGSFAGT